MTSGHARHRSLPPRPRMQTAASVSDSRVAPRLDHALAEARGWLLSQQHPEGYWVGELEGDTILESEYVLLLVWLGHGQSEVVQQCARYIRRQQLPEGGWSLYPGGPLEISSSVKAYWVLKIAGYDPDSEEMTRARNAILAAGGAEKINSFTRYYLALLGIISYQQCPAVPPELMLAPRWFPLNIYEMSAWSRTIVVPLSLLWAFQPRTELAVDHRIDEIFLTSPEALPVSMPPAEQLDEMKQVTWFPWDTFFRLVDRTWKWCEALHLKPLRVFAVRRAANWMRTRFEHSDGLGAIFPPIIWSVIALRCLGYDEDSPEVQSALKELEKLTIREDDSARLEPCRSPVWDTAITVNALRDASLPADHPQLVRAVDWLLSKEVRRPGDWSHSHPDVEPGGWYFEFQNEFYPDIDDTIMVVMALARCLPGASHADWSAALVKSTSRQRLDEDLALFVSGKAESTGAALTNMMRVRPMLSAIRRGVRWVGAMQGRNGGWGAFDSDNDREILTQVPFADHNAMIDPPTADITARVLEMYGRLGMTAREPMFEKALEFVWNEQEPDSCWYGRWGVNYIYGTWQVLVGLAEFGIPSSDLRLQAAADWLKRTQQASGAWGESPRSYDEPELRGTGPVTASQTAWALMGLMAVGEHRSEAVKRGINYLLDTQTDEGTWQESSFTGTGFPRVFYLRYHLYRHYFPLMALGRYQRLVEADTGTTS